MESSINSFHVQALLRKSDDYARNFRVSQTIGWSSIIVLSILGLFVVVLYRCIECVADDEEAQRLKTTKRKLMAKFSASILEEVRTWSATFIAAAGGGLGVLSLSFEEICLKHFYILQYLQLCKLNLI